MSLGLPVLKFDDLDALPRLLHAVEDAEERKLGMRELRLRESALLSKLRLHVGGHFRGAVGGLRGDAPVGLVLVAEHAHGAVRQLLGARTQTERGTGPGMGTEPPLPLGDGPH